MPETAENGLRSVPSGALESVRRWIPEIVLLGVVAAATVGTGGRWLDPTRDAGLWWSAADRVAQGGRLYEDVYVQYGPLSLLVLGGLMRFLGSSAAVFAAANWTAAIAVAALVLALTRPLLETLERIALVGLCVGYALFAPGSWPLVFSYSPGSVHALALGLAAIGVARHGSSKALSWIAGALAGLAFAAKQEIGIAAFLALSAAAVASRSLPALLRSAAAFFAVAGSVLALVLSQVPVETLVHDNHFWPLAPVPPKEWQHLFRAVSGLALPDIATVLADTAFRVLSIATVLAIGALVISRERRPRSWAPVVIALLVLGVDYVLRAPSVFGPLKPMYLATFVSALVALRGLIDGAGARAMRLAALGTFAALVGLRTVTQGEPGGAYTPIGHFLACATWLIFVATVLPEILPGGSRPRELARRGWAVLALLFSVIVAMEGVRSMQSIPRRRIPTPAGTIWVPSKSAPFFEFLGRELRKGERALILPESHAVDVLFGVRPATPDVVLMPGWLDARAETRLIDLMRTDPPNVLVLFDRDTSEFGIAPFGQGFGIRLLEQIEGVCREIPAPQGGRLFRCRGD